MPSSPLHHLTGRSFTALQFTVTCPTCDDAAMELVNGTYRTGDGAGRANMVVMRCPECCTYYDLILCLQRSAVRDPKRSGAAQRKAARDDN